MIRFGMDVSGEIQMDRGIGRFSEACSDYRPIWPVVIEEFHQMEVRQFRSEGDEGGSPWAPLSEPYAAWKAATYGDKPILERTGRLYRSLTSFDPDAVIKQQPKLLTLGTAVPYAIYHQSIKPRSSNLPRRPEIQVTDDFRKQVMRLLHAYLVQVATQSGFRRGLAPLDQSRMAAAFRRGRKA